MKRTLKFGAIDVTIVGKNLSDRAIKAAHARSVATWGCDLIRISMDEGATPIPYKAYDQIARQELAVYPERGPLWAYDFAQRKEFIPCADAWDWSGRKYPVEKEADWATEYRISDYGIAVYGLLKFLHTTSIRVEARMEEVRENHWEIRTLTGDPVEEIIF